MERFIMFRTSWFPWRSLRQRNGWLQHLSSSRAGRRHSPLILERLEDRTALSNFNAVTVSDLITDINAANAAGGTNTITLTAATSSPYVLTAVDNATDGPTGLPVISGGGTKVAADNLTIIGNGDTIERSTASGTPDFRPFDVANSASLTLQNLTLENGLAFGAGISAEGGAIYNQGTLVLSAVTVQGNTAQGSDGTVTNNKHGSPGKDAAGGAIWSAGTLTLENGSLIQSNQAIGGNGSSDYSDSDDVGGNGLGGGIYVAAGTATLTGVTVNANSAQGGQGGTKVLIGGSPPAPTTFGEAASGNGEGGGLYMGGTNLALSSDTLTGNQALGGNAPFQNIPPKASGDALGGALYLSAGTATLTGLTVNNNSALGGDSYNLALGHGYGGGVYVAQGNVTLSGDTIDSNVAGGLKNYSLVDPSGFGGGIYVASGTVTLCSDTIEANTASLNYGASLGGGVYIPSGATVYIDSFTVAHTINNTDSSGTNGSTANIDGTYILQNC
jgi:hypothetical protein